MPRPSKSKERLDVLLVSRGLAETRQQAQAIILAGEVLVAGQKVTKAGANVPGDAAIEITGARPRYASRAGMKLEGALQDFGLTPEGKTCLDLGASTGGFTDCLLQHGAARVFAVDVNTSQLSWKLQNDPRVICVRCNARNLQEHQIGSPVQLVTVDLSFISVTKVLAAAVRVAAPGGEFLILVKPQFELQKNLVGRGGIVRDAAHHHLAVESVTKAAAGCGLHVLGVAPSRITGAEGNQEYFLYARK